MGRANWMKGCSAPLMLVLCLPSNAQTLDTAIRPQLLADALQIFAAQTGTTLIFGPFPKCVITHGAAAGLSLDQTIRQLLQGTNLTYRFTGERTIIISKAADSKNADCRDQTETA